MLSRDLRIVAEVMLEITKERESFLRKNVKIAIQMIRKCTTKIILNH